MPRSCLPPPAAYWKIWRNALRRSRAVISAEPLRLYAPLYLSNYCYSGCAYCGFASNRKTSRHKLTPDELEAELTALKDMGMEEILLLTGERNAIADYEYVRDCVARAASRVNNVAVEVFPMSEEEYRGLAAAGCTAVTLYQETYHPGQYERLHHWGPKRDYASRLDAPARALAGGIRVAGLGALLGLSDPLLDMLCLYRHASYLRQRFWKGGVSISFPRVRPQSGGYVPEFSVDEKFLAQIIFAFRICLPGRSAGPLDSRESTVPRRHGWGGDFKDERGEPTPLLAATASGQLHSSGQFEVSDDRDAGSFCAMLHGKGLQPVFKNWDVVYRESPRPARRDGEPVVSAARAVRPSPLSRRDRGSRAGEVFAARWC